MNKISLQNVNHMWIVQGVCSLALQGVSIFTLHWKCFEEKKFKNPQAF